MLRINFSYVPMAPEAPPTGHLRDWARTMVTKVTCVASRKRWIPLVQPAHQKPCNLNGLVHADFPCMTYSCCMFWPLRHMPC